MDSVSKKILIVDRGAYQIHLVIHAMGSGHHYGLKQLAPRFLYDRISIIIEINVPGILGLCHKPIEKETNRVYSSRFLWQL